MVPASKSIVTVPSNFTFTFTLHQQVQEIRIAPSGKFCYHIAIHPIRISAIMKQKIKNPIGLRGLCGLLLILSPVFLSGGIDQSTKDALKVAHVIKTIEQAPKAKTGEERVAEISEREANAYIAWRLAKEKTPIVKHLTVKLLENSHVQGNIGFDASRLNLNTLLGNELNFDFKGVVQTREHEAKLHLIALSLGGYDVKPQILDYVIESAGMATGTKVSGIQEWYALPKEVKRVAIQKSKAIVYY